MQLSESDPRLAARIQVIVINPNTERLPEALDYCDLLFEEFMPYFAPLMYETYDRAALVKLMREQALARAKGSSNPNQVEIDRAIADLQRADDEDYYYTEDEIAEYRENVAPYLVFPIVRFMSADTIAKEYVRGRLDVDGLIQKLNEAVNLTAGE